MIVRINWSRVPYFMITIKKPFGNLGLIQDTITNSKSLIYVLKSVVDRTMVYRFYEHEIIKEGL